MDTVWLFDMLSLLLVLMQASIEGHQVLMKYRNIQLYLYILPTFPSFVVFHQKKKELLMTNFIIMYSYIYTHM